jgi:hypothetical protein
MILGGQFGLFLILNSSDQIFEERPEASEAIGGIYVMLDDVEGEVIGAGEGPDGDSQQEGEFEGGEFKENGGRRDEAGEEEEEAFEIDDAGVGQVHGGLFEVTGECGGS